MICLRSTLTRRSILTILACLAASLMMAAPASAKVAGTPLNELQLNRMYASIHQALGTPYQLGAPRITRCRRNIARPHAFDSGTFLRWTLCHSNAISVPNTVEGAALDDNLKRTYSKKLAYGNVLLCRNMVGRHYGLAGIITRAGRVAYAGSPVRVTSLKGFMQACTGAEAYRIRT